MYDQLKDQLVAQNWFERLNYESQQISWVSSREIINVILASLLAGLIAKIPDLLHINEEFFYPGDISFIVFPILTAYFLWKSPLDKRKAIVIAVVTFLSILFVNFLPDNMKSDTLMFTCIHMPFPFSF